MSSLFTILSGVQNSIRQLPIFAQPKYLPFQKQVKGGFGFTYKGNTFIPYTDLPIGQSALKTITFQQLFLLLSLLYLSVVSFLIDWHATIVVIVSVLTLFYFSDLLFNLFLLFRSFRKKPEIKVTKNAIAKVAEKDWPMYTIFCPLYKEWNVLPQFIEAMSNMDYPKDKLQVMLLLEEDDHTTVDKVKQLALPSFFDIVIVPDSKPKTKPKACNYGLLKAKGDYVVIYDAEDIPETDQLKKAVLGFNKSPKDVACIQAKLNFYNPTQNLLTRAFTAEYSLWFDLVLTGLQTITAPIPLGGTSNHFKTDFLKKVHGWDSFNVTEDCDLGIRLIKQNYRTAIIESTTYEEANSDLSNWISQRTRWIKGYIQTYFVHMRKPSELMKSIKKPHLLTFQLVVGGKILSMIINPILWMLTIVYFVFRPIIGDFIESFYLTPILYIGVTTLFIGNFLYMYYYVIGCAKRGRYDIILYAALIPLYWLAMSIAAVKAGIEFIRKPHYWAKTKHGLHMNNHEESPTSISMPSVVIAK